MYEPTKADLPRKNNVLWHVEAIQYRMFVSSAYFLAL